MNEFHRYLKQQRLNLGNQVRDRTIIYLDLNFWLRLRNANTQQSNADTTFLQKVFDLSESKKCIFPISEMTYWEILKQSDNGSRRATIELVDRLSEGIAIINMRERAALETRTWILKASGKPVHELTELIWTNLPFAIGYDMILMLPTSELQRMEFDRISKMSLLEATANVTEVFSYKDDVVKFNNYFEQYRHQYKTYEELLAIEFEGIVDVNKETIQDAMDCMQYSATGRYMTVEQRELNETPQFIVDLLKKGVVKSELPLFHIIASLNAWTRWKQKPFKDGNDTIDFYHASFALPYADYFFTDRRLTNGIKESKLDTLYNCTVEHEPSNILDLLESL